MLCWGKGINIVYRPIYNDIDNSIRHPKAFIMR